MKTVKERQSERSRLCEKYIKKYPSQMRTFIDKSPLSKVRSVTEEEVINLGMMFDQYKDFEQMVEADGNITQLGTLPKVALDSLTVAVGASPLNLIAATQPIDDVQGIVYFEDWVAQNTRGNVNSGDKIFSTLGAPDKYVDGFTTDNFINSPVIDAGAGGTAAYANLVVNSSVDYPGPINPQKCILSGTVVFDDGTCIFANVIPDPETGEFSQMVEAGTSGNYKGVFGVIDFEAGKITALEFTEAPSAGANKVNVAISYQNVPEANTDLQKAILVLQTKPINARFFSLKTTFGLAEKFMLKKRIGLDIEDVASRRLTQTISQEICNTAIKMLDANVPAESVHDGWERTPGSGVSYFEHKMTFMDALADTDALMVKQAGRGSVNCLVAGRKVAAVLKMLPGFTKVFDDNSFGPHIYGSLDGIPVVRVPYEDVLDEKKLIGLHKESELAAPLVYAPYMPLVLTELLPMGYNPLMNMKGAAIWAGLDPMITNFLVELPMTETTFKY